MHREYAAHGSFAHLKLGRLPARHDPRTLRLAKYLEATALPPIPPQLAPPAVPEWPMYANDRLGDCTCAAVGHMIEAWSQAVGALVEPAETDVERLYIPETGSGDTGRAELDVLNYWRHHGVGRGGRGHRRDKILAFAAVDPSRQADVRTAAYLFGGVYIGVALPKTAQGQAEWDVVGDGETGDSAPGSWGGHAVNVVGYDQAGLTVVTWGGLLRLTWGFWATYVDEAYAVLSHDFVLAGKTPAGFDLATLRADLAAIAAP